MRYSFKSWSIQQLMLDDIRLYHHSRFDAYNTWMSECRRPLGKCTRSYDNSSRNSPAVVSRNAEILMTPQSINAVASNTCCRHHCVQLYPRDKIAVLRSRMYNTTTVLFRSHMKLDVHRQFHKDILGRNVVTLEGVDVVRTHG